MREPTLCLLARSPARFAAAYPLAAAFLLSLVLLSSRVAQAAQEPPPLSENVAVLKLPFLGITKEVEGLLRKALHEALLVGGFNLLPGTLVEDKLGRDQELNACVTRSCFARIALTLGVQRVIEGEIQHPQRSTYTAQMHIRDLRTGALSTLVEERCDICSTDEARQMITRAAQRLVRLLGPPMTPGAGTEMTGVLQVESQPLGAQVLIDGLRQEDLTPAMFLLAVGVHSLELRARGYKTVRRPVEIGSGQHVPINLELIPQPPKRPWLTTLSIFSTVGALALAATAGVYLYYDGKPAYGQDGCLSPQAHCPQMYDNVLSGSLFLAGAGLLATGAILGFYFNNAPPTRKRLISP